MKQGLFEKLQSYKQKEIYPFHMPAHKRNTAEYVMGETIEYDITEIEGFDNLANPQEVIKDLEERIRVLYQARRSHILLGGSTIGILAAISACANGSHDILMARNSHKSVYNAVFINKLNPIYIVPNIISEFSIHNCIFPEQIEEELKKNRNIKVVVITSPTYEGIVSDIGKISEIIHRYGAILIVDEAHGAHLGFYHKLPFSAVTQEADIIIQSLHKTLPAMTQTAILHVNNPQLFRAVHQYINIFQTSSPSYILMSSIDKCIKMLENNKEELFQKYVNKLEKFYTRMKQLKYLSIMTKEHIHNEHLAQMDQGKILIYTSKALLTGKELHDILLHQYNIQTEMSTLHYTLAMTSILDTEEGFQKLGQALLEIDSHCHINKNTKAIFDNEKQIIIPKQIKKPYEIHHEDTEYINLKTAKGRIAGNNIILYPPGVPLIVSGELIEQHIIYKILQYVDAGLEIIGIEYETSNIKVNVVRI